jgi:chorismate synthase
MPAGVQVTTADIELALERRRKGYGRGARMKFEQDAVRIIGGVRHGLTMGSPIAIEIANSEWPKWTAIMSADPVAESALQIDGGVGDPLEVARNKPLTRPRPGHADFAAMQKFGFDDARPALERASARETAARVALGAVAAAFLKQVAGIDLVSHVVGIGEISTQGLVPTPIDRDAVEDDPVRCLDREASARMMAEIDSAKQEGDTLGGVVEVLAYGVPVGLGGYSQGDTRLDAQLAAAVMGIQAVKGVEIGDGFAQARMRGTAAHDEIVFSEVNGVSRLTNHAGGIEGGMSNGQPIVVRAAVKPISSVPKALRTIDVATGEPALAIHQRSDVTAVVPAAVVAEAEVALVLARALLLKFGGDSVGETKRNLNGFCDALK